MNLKNKFQIAIISLIICLSVSITSCKKDESATPGNGEVLIQSMSFSPSSITITAGETVKWTNNDAMTHTVTSNDGLFESGDLANGSSFSKKFPDKGTFNYHCTYHVGMTGTVIVN